LFPEESTAYGTDHESRRGKSIEPKRSSTSLEKEQDKDCIANQRNQDQGSIEQASTGSDQTRCVAPDETSDNRHQHSCPQNKRRTSVKWAPPEDTVKTQGGEKDNYAVPNEHRGSASNN